MSRPNFEDSMADPMNDRRLAEIRTWQDAPRPSSERQVNPGVVPELLAELDRVTVVKDTAFLHARQEGARADLAEAALARVEALHSQAQDAAWCAWCDEDYPCATIQAIQTT